MGCLALAIASIAFAALPFVLIAMERRREARLLRLARDLDEEFKSYQVEVRRVSSFVEGMAPRVVRQ